MNKEDKKLRENLQSNLNDALLNKELLISVINIEIESLNAFINDDNAIKNAIKDAKDNLKEMLLEEVLNDLSEEEKEDYINNYKKTRTTKTGIKNDVKDKIGQLYTAIVKINNMYDKPIYKDYVNDLVYSKKLKYEFFSDIGVYTISLIINKTIKFWIPRAYDDIDEATIEDEKRFRAYVNFNWEIEEKIKDKLKASDKKDTLLNFKQLDLFNLEYNNNAYLVESNLINNISRIKNIDLQNIMLVKGLNYEVTSLDKNKEELNTLLTSFDKLVLETIVYKFYYERGLKGFTNRQLATEIYNEYSREPKTDKQLDAIDVSIEKLRRINIKLDYKSIEQFENENIKVSRDNYLISVERTGISRDKDNNKTITYEFIGRQFYLDFLYLEGVKPVEYDRALMYENVKGLIKSKEGQGLRRYLLGRIALFNGVDMKINFNEIYDELGLTSDKYNYNTLKNERKKARIKAENYLKELQKQYNFKYQLDNTGKSIKGFIIKEK